MQLLRLWVSHTHYMDAQSLPAPLYALNKARACLSDMQRATTFDALAESWEQYLIAHQRVWNKAEAQYRTEKFWPSIRSKYAHLRNTDQLLVYLHHARHADEHGIAPITARAAGGIAIGGNGHLRQLRIDERGVFLGTDVFRD